MDFWVTLYATMVFLVHIVCNGFLVHIVCFQITTIIFLVNGFPRELCVFSSYHNSFFGDSVSCNGIFGSTLCITVGSLVHVFYFEVTTILLIVHLMCFHVCIFRVNYGMSKRHGELKGIWGKLKGFHIRFDNPD